MGYPGSELESMRRDPAGDVMGFVRGECMLAVEAPADVKLEIAVVMDPTYMNLHESSS